MSCGGFVCRALVRKSGTTYGRVCGLCRARHVLLVRPDAGWALALVFCLPLHHPPPAHPHGLPLPRPHPVPPQILRRSLVDRFQVLLVLWVATAPALPLKTRGRGRDLILDPHFEREHAPVLLKAQPVARVSVLNVGLGRCKHHCVARLNKPAHRHERL